MAQMKNSTMVVMALVFLVAIIGTLYVVAPRMGTVNIDNGNDPANTVPAGQNMIEFGTASSVTLNAYDQTSDSETEVYPEYYIIDSSGAKLVNGAGANTSSTTVGETLDVYGSDEDATYYLDPLMGFKVITTAPTLKLDAHTIAARTSMAITLYDKDDDALTAEAQANKSVGVDYVGGAYGTSECQAISAKLRNEDDNSVYRLGAICVGRGGDVGTFDLTASGWEKTTLPNELDDATITTYSDTNTSSTHSWKECYVPTTGSYIELKEWEEIKVPFKICSDSDGTDDNTGDVASILFVDYGYEKAADGSIVGDFFVHDENEEVSDVGMSEASEISAAYGNYIASTLELQ